MKRLASLALLALATIQLGLMPGVTAAAEPASLPAGTRLYLTLDENVTSARGGDDVGTIVRCRVWRDVEDRASSSSRTTPPPLAASIRSRDGTWALRRQGLGGRRRNAVRRRPDGDAGGRL